MGMDENNDDEGDINDNSRRLQHGTGLEVEEARRTRGQGSATPMPEEHESGYPPWWHDLLTGGDGGGSGGDIIANI